MSYFSHSFLSMEVRLTCFLFSPIVLKKDHLSGVKVLHGLDKVIEGGAVVMTLKDQSILADGDINEGNVLLFYLLLLVPSDLF